MSRIGRAPIAIPAGVEVKIEADNVVTVKGPKGTLTQQFNPNMTIAMEDGVLHVTRPNDAKENRSLHGLTRTLLHNMVVGVTEGYQEGAGRQRRGLPCGQGGQQAGDEPGLLPPGHRGGGPRHRASRSPTPTRSSSTAATSSRWASLPPK